MLRFSTFWRLCSDVLLWCAKEKECKDSDGKRARSSLKGSVGEDGPETKVSDAFREPG